MYALLALVGALPVPALAGTAVTASVSAPAGGAVAGSTVQVSCWAEGSPSMGAPTSAVGVDVAVTGGTVNPTQLTGAASTTCSSGSGGCSVIQGFVTWTTPAAPGTYTATCTGTFQGTFGGSQTNSASATLTTIAGVVLPPPGVDSLTASATEAFAGDTVQLTATAHGTAITYQWSATGGTIAWSGPQATWTAPSENGPYVVTVTVTDSAGQTASQGVTLSSVWAKAAESVSAKALSFPRRVAVDACGSILVTDPRLSAVAVLSSTGQVLRTIRVYGEPAGVAVGPGGRFLVSDVATRAVRVYNPAGRPIGVLGAGPGEFQTPVDVAVTPDGTAWVADAGAQQVKAYDGGGRPLRSFPVSGRASGIAVDPVAGRVFVSDSLTSQVLVYSLAGNALGVISSYGAGAGILVRPGGVALGSDGNVYVADAYQAVLQVFAPTGAFMGLVGGFGTSSGRLDVPLGVAADSHGHVFVASTQTARIESYALKSATASAPTGTAGCVLTVARRDDDDGDDDGPEGQRWGLVRRTPDPQPLSGGRHRGAGNTTRSASGTSSAGRTPVLIATSKSSGPGLVRLSTSLQSGVPCPLSWKQTAGPLVKLLGAETLTPSFVARTAGRYGFRGVASCGAAGTATALAQVTIVDVAPVARAGATRVVAPGDAFTLAGDASSDANGDALSLRWDQTLGVPVVGGTQGAQVAASGRQPGLLGFELVATDPAGHQAADDVNVLVVSADEVAPTAIVSGGGAARVGSPVTLDASGSIVAGGSKPRFIWTQLAGAPVSLDGSGKGVLRFVPDRAGRYAFNVSVAAGAIMSPAARVDVFASGSAGLPTARATAPATAAVGEPLQLDASRSAAAAGGVLAFRWRQVAGPAAGLTDADQVVATAVAFEPGAYVFELAVREGDAESLPVRVELQVTGESPAPVASARAWADGELVTLDGRRSRSGSGTPLRYEWTQVGGPWVPLEGAASHTARFRALVPGVYRFELVVIDGAVRSAPASAQVMVGESGKE